MPLARSSGARGPAASARAAASAPASPTGTTMPAPPTTAGSAPASLDTTGTPQAIASIATRPNCSVHDGVGNDGTASTSSER